MVEIAEETITSQASFVLAALKMVSEQLHKQQKKSCELEELTKYVDAAEFTALRWAFEELSEEDQSIIERRLDPA